MRSLNVPSVWRTFPDSMYVRYTGELTDIPVYPEGITRTFGKRSFWDTYTVPLPLSSVTAPTLPALRLGTIGSTLSRTQSLFRTHKTLAVVAYLRLIFHIPSSRGSSSEKVEWFDPPSPLRVWGPLSPLSSHPLP